MTSHILVQIHPATCNRNGCEFVSCCKKLPDIRKSNGMLGQFYVLVTGHEDAFYQMCMVLSSVIEKACKNFEGTIVPHDTVIDALRKMAAK